MLQGVEGLRGAGTKVLRDGLQIWLGWVGVDITIPALRHRNVEALHSQSELGMGLDATVGVFLIWQQWKRYELRSFFLKFCYIYTPYINWLQHSL